jgi:hypothetical protein
MKRFILALAIGLSTLGIAGVASAHPPRCEPVRVYRPVCAPIIAAPVIVQSAPVVVAPCETIVRPVYHHYYRGHYRR